MLAVVDWGTVWPVVASGVLVVVIVRGLPRVTGALTKQALEDAFVKANLATRDDVRELVRLEVAPMRKELTDHLRSEEDLSRKTLDIIGELRDKRDRERDEIWNAIRALQAGGR